MGYRQDAPLGVGDGSGVNVRDKLKMIQQQKTKKQQCVELSKALNAQPTSTLACYPKLCLLNTLHIHVYRHKDQAAGLLLASLSSHVYLVMLP